MENAIEHVRVKKLASMMTSIMFFVFSMRLLVIV